MDFRFLEVDKNDTEMLEKVFEFRYKIFLEIFPEHLKNSNCSNNLEFDKYDEYSTHFATLDEDDNVCATVRLIYNSPIGYPTENNTKFDNSLYDKNKLGEMSRIFIDKKYRDMKTTKKIIQTAKKFMIKNVIKFNIDYTYGTLEKNFLRLLKIYKMNYKVIGELQKCKSFGYRYPCILYTKDLLHDNPELIELPGKQYA